MHHNQELAIDCSLTVPVQAWVKEEEGNANGSWALLPHCVARLQLTTREEGKRHIYYALISFSFLLF